MPNGLSRTGQTSAVVEVKLCNVGEKAYKPDMYGESVTVVRTVTQSSSTYKLKDARGRVVVDKKVKEELDRILLNFNIQVKIILKLLRVMEMLTKLAFSPLENDLFRWTTQSPC